MIRKENSSRRKTGKKTSRSKKNNFTGIIFWSVFAIIILICFFAAKGKIAKVLKETNFFTEVVGSEPKLITDFINSQDQTKNKEDSKENKTKKDKKTQTTENKIEIPIQQEEQRNESELTERKEIVKKVKVPEQIKKDETTKQIPQEKTITEKPKMHLNLCFVQIDSDGKINRKEILRSVEKNDSPLTTAINQLLAGPLKNEEKKGMISVIPEGTKLLSASISNKTAILNFNENFSYNTYGVQGQLNQLMQIVYTSTSFSTIDNVLFLIEGEKKQYLGEEGVWIGSPLGRDSFN